VRRVAAGEVEDRCGDDAAVGKVESARHGPDLRIGGGDAALGQSAGMSPEEACVRSCGGGATRQRLQRYVNPWYLSLNSNPKVFVYEVA
jgi:hypothetical protein